MQKTQLNRGLKKRVMYLESKGSPIDGAQARVGWVTFSKSGHTVYYKDKTLTKANGISGNFMDVDTREEYWISGIKKRGANSHPAERYKKPVVDDDALDEYKKIRESN